MNSETIYIIILLFLCADFIFERFLEGLNIRAMSPVLPEKLKGIYDEKEYKRFQSYKKENNRFGLISSAFSFTVTVLFLAAGGFGLYNDWIVSRTDSILWQTLFFMLGLSVVSTLLEMPFSWYATFRIEEKYGFNKSTLNTWITDAVKGVFLSLIIGGLILSAVVGFYLWTRKPVLDICLGIDQLILNIHGHVLFPPDCSFIQQTSPAASRLSAG